MFEESVISLNLSNHLSKHEVDLISRILKSKEEYQYIFDIIEDDFTFTMNDPRCDDRYKVSRISFPNRLLMVINETTKLGMRFEFWKNHHDVSIGMFDEAGQTGYGL